MKIEELHKLFLLSGRVSTDTRKLIPNSIFFALKGENFDGNRFALEAIETVCSFAVVDDASLPKHERLILVPDVLASLQKLAHFHRMTYAIPVIGITGSNGKTTTKELITAVLSQKYKVCATLGNLNNHIGVPLTLLSLTDHEIAIIEMGANHIGEIAVLSSIAAPNFGIITNIGKAHLEGFGSPEGVVKAKSELYSYISAHHGKAFVDADNPLLVKLLDEKKCDPIYYGSTLKSIAHGKISENSHFLKTNITLPQTAEYFDIQTKLVGDYNLKNILAAACIGSYFGVNAKEISLAISGYLPSNSRSQLIVTKKNKIVLDAYNANPSSMEVSITNFLAIKEELPKMTILGDMLELGGFSHKEHLAVIERLNNSRLHKVFLVGPEFVKASKSSSIQYFQKVEELIEHLRLNPVTDHCILLKGSRGIKLEKLLDVL